MAHILPLLALGSIFYTPTVFKDQRKNEREREEKKKNFGEERATAELWFVSLNDRRSSRRSLSIVRLRHCGTTHRRPFICHCSGEPKSMALKDDRSSLKSYGRQKKTSGCAVVMRILVRSFVRSVEKGYVIASIDTMAFV